MTTLESLSVCTPVVTFPSGQHVPALAQGMIQALNLTNEHEKMLITSSAEDYIRSVVRLSSGDSLLRLRFDICTKLQEKGRVFEEMKTVEEWERFLVHAARSL